MISNYYENMDKKITFSIGIRYTFYKFHYENTTNVIIIINFIVCFIFIYLHNLHSPLKRFVYQLMIKVNI